MKHAVLALVRAVVGLFYRRVEISGLEHLPAQGPVLLIANHNNGLMVGTSYVVFSPYREGAPAPGRLRREVDTLEDPGPALASRPPRLRAGGEKKRFPRR